MKRLCLVLLITACGKESETNSSLPILVTTPPVNGNTPPPAGGTVAYSSKVFANLDFQPSKIPVVVGSQVTINGTGQVTVGQRALVNGNLVKHYVGIQGGAGGSFSGTQFNPSPDPLAPMLANCGVSANESLLNQLSNGTTASLVATGNLITYGPCCGSVARGIQNPFGNPETNPDLYLGQYRVIIDKHSCVATAPIASLVMKIVPPNTALNEVPAMAVGTAFSTNPYVATVAGELYFKVNDIHLLDNEGFWNLSVNVKAP